MWFRLRLDLRFRDIARAALEGLLPGKRERAEKALTALWPEPDEIGCFLSVRSGLDLLLDSLALPEGSEVLMSALTIPDMVEVVRQHELVPVPLDLDPATGRVAAGALRDSLSPRTRIVLVAHLFGDVAPLDEFEEVLADRDILLVEDCAQAFSGLGGYLGHRRADVCLFSFGPIKTATAFAGALFRIKDRALLASLRAKQASWPVAGRAEFLRRVLVYGCLHGVTHRHVYPLVAALCRIAGKDLNRLLVESARSFGGTRLLVKIRRQPGAPLLRFMTYRLRTYDRAQITRRAAHGRSLAQALPPSAVVLPREHDQHHFWLFPLRVGDPEALQAQLLAEGFDSSAGHSLAVVPASPDAGSMTTPETGAQELLRSLLFVPVYAALRDSELLRLAEVLRGALESPAS